MSNKNINKDLMTKITSAFLAIILWFVVLNLDNPYNDRTIVVELDIKNENMLVEKNLYLVNKNYRKSIEIVIRGRKASVDSVNPSDFYAILDFAKVKSVNDKYIEIDGPYYTKDDKQITIVSMNPKVINIQLENIIKSDFPIKAELKGTPKSSYVVTGVKVDPASITVQDRESMINLIGEVKVLIDVSDIDRDKKITKQPCLIYNKEGEEIVSLSNQFFADVTLEVGKEVAIVLDIEGKPAEDHVYVGYSIVPEKVMLRGDFDILASLAELKTEKINIEGISESKQYNVSIVLPEGVELFNMENSANAYVMVEKLQEKEIEIEEGDITIKNMDASNDYLYEISPDDSKIILKGRQDYLKNIYIGNLNPSIDVNGFTEGIHKIKITVNQLPEIEILHLPTVEVKVSIKSVETSETTEQQMPSESETNVGESGSERTKAIF